MPDDQYGWHGSGILGKIVKRIELENFGDRILFQRNVIPENQIGRHGHDQDRRPIHEHRLYRRPSAQRSPHRSDRSGVAGLGGGLPESHAVSPSRIPDTPVPQTEVETDDFC
jgi:hypothetical protein